MRRRKEWHDSVDWAERFRDMNTKGAHEFGLLWLKATEDAVALFRNAGFSNELEDGKKRLASAISATIYKALLRARASYDREQEAKP